MTSQPTKRSLPHVFAPAGVAFMVPTTLLWLCLLLSLAGMEFSLPAKSCCALGGCGGLLVFFGLPILGLALSLASLVSARARRQPVSATGYAALIAGAGLIVLAVVATSRL